MFPCQHKYLNDLAIILFGKKCVNHDANPSSWAHMIILISSDMELGRVFGGKLFCLCLFVCFFQLQRWVIILVLSLTSGRGFIVFCFCFVLFFLQNVPFPHHMVRLIFFSVSPVGKVFCFLLFVCCLLLFCFVLFFSFSFPFFFLSFLFSFFLFFFFLFLLPKIPPPLISKYGAPLSLFYYTNDGGHYVVDNFEFP